MAFKPSDPITQYEGLILTKSDANAVRNGPEGASRATHFATTAHRGCVINGYSLSPCVGGIAMSHGDLRGKGGGSFANHCSSGPNAKLVRDNSRTEGDSYGVFLVATKVIKPGKFIHVDYGKAFVGSKISNI
jgi:hypothetical protein